MMRVEWSCTQCGAAGAIDYTGDPPVSRIRLDVDNAHAVATPWCPLDRDRITLFLSMAPR